MSNHDYLVGKYHEFEDGQTIRIVQIKERNTDEYWVTYECVLGPNAIPKRSVMEINEFLSNFSQLFDK